MPITLTITDNEDGTGGVATIAGAAGGSSNQLYRSLFGGDFGQSAWTAAGSRTGDGTITLTSPGIPLGYYLWRLDNAGAFAALSYQNLSDAATRSIIARAMDAIVLKIQSLGLSGLSSGNVAVRWAPRVLGPTSLPAVRVFPIDSETFPGILTKADDIGYPVGVAILDAQNQDFSANLDRNTLWREKIIRAIRYQRLDGVPECYTVKPEEFPIVALADLFDANLFQSPMLFRVYTRTTRGV